MNHYSIFERGMHWVMLVFIFLKGIVFYITNIWNWGLSATISPLDAFFIIMNLLSNYFIYIILVFIYLLLFFLNRKIKKNVSIIITFLLLLNLLFDVLEYSHIILELKGILTLTLVVLFLVSFNTNEKIVFAREEDDFILDDLED